MVGPSPDIFIFDRNHVRQARERAASDFTRHGFLFDRTAAALSDRLNDIRRDFPLALQIGARGAIKRHGKIGACITMDSAPLLLRQAPAPKLLADEETLPFAPESLDLALSNLCLHSVNDLPGALAQIRRALKPDGLFLAAMLGGETLFELRHSLMQAEINLKGGASPRIAPFADKQQTGALLQRAGFALPVVDSDIVKVSYETIFHLMRDLRGMGEGNAIRERSRSFTGRTLFLEAERLYRERFGEDGGRITASFEVIYLIGWAPHASQQKPLRPGSAQNRLAEALGTAEIKTEDRTRP